MARAFICFAILLILQPATPLDTKKTSDKYGPYIITKTESEICHGPKLKDQAELSVEFSLDSDNNINGSFLYNVTETAKIDEIRITVYSVKNHKKSVMWNYKLTEPCKHFAVGAIITTNLHTSPEKCVMKKGMNKFVINITDAVYKFYGHSFFYGDYILKINSMSKKGNLGCLIMHQIFEKKV